jgi:hypothetical protein
MICYCCHSSFIITGPSTIKWFLETNLNIFDLCNLCFDNSNPLAFGYTDYHTMRLTTDVFQLADGTVFQLKKDALPVNGFVGSKVKKAQSEALTAGVHSIGSGSIVYLVDNPLFRGFWENGKLMVVNAIFMVNRQ